MPFPGGIIRRTTVRALSTAASATKGRAASELDSAERGSDWAANDKKPVIV